MSASAKAEVYEIFLDTQDLTLLVGNLVVQRGDMPNYVPHFQFTYTDDYLANT